MAKSAAQIRRMQKRAKERGEVYVAPEKKPNENNGGSSSISEIDTRKANAAQKLQEELKRLEKNEEGLNSKDKRTAKRKAEAIALEEANGVDKTSTSNETSANDAEGAENETNKIANAEELLNWYKDNEKRLTSHLKKQKRKLESQHNKETNAKIDAYETYKTTMDEIESNADLNAKDRRSAKRKAEAIACEESGCSSITDLTEWYEANPQLTRQSKKKKKSKNDDYDDRMGTKNPYILFVGQIPYTTTEDDIYKHFQKYIGKKDITKATMTVRIPQDKEKNEKMKQNNNKDVPQQEEEVPEQLDDYGAEELYDYEDFQSEEVKNQSYCRGFAFAEFKDPELMYECLKLHHTNLNGRRINVSRAAGGGKEARKEKHKQRRQEQDDYISSTVDKIIKDYIDRGELQEGELDDGAILLCKRRSAAIVEAALGEYIEQRKDKDLENPSSFFTRIICDVSEEGEVGTQSYVQKKKKQNNYDSFRKSKTKKYDQEDTTNFGTLSKFANEGVDMSVSHDTESANNMSKIFPSMSRGRGRGRGSILT